MTAITNSPLFDERSQSLVGRANDQAALRDCLHSAVSGSGRLVLIAGEAGIGKTALAKTLWSEAADHGALVLAGHCYDLTETPPYGPWVEILAQAPADAACPSLTALGESPAITANQTALFVQVRDCLTTLSQRQPMVLVLEDQHWADPGSLDLLRYLARGVDALPLLLVVTYRADEVTRRHPLFSILPLIVREAQAARIDLRRLEPADVQEMIAARYALAEADEERLVAYLVSQGGGNPLYIGELLRTLEEERLLIRVEGAWSLGALAQAYVPPLLRQVIDGRLQRLGPEAHDLLAVASVIGQEVSLTLWSAVSGTAEETLLSVVEAAIEARLLEAPADGSTVRFVHALIREALYEGLLPPRRRIWHRRVAEALLATPAPDPDAVAFHLQRASDARAAEWLIRAGERARRSYALLTAADRFDHALQLLEAQGAPPAERANLLYRLARMRRYADPRQALVFLDDAVALAEEAGDRILRAYIESFRGALRCAAGDIRRGLAELEADVAAIDALSADERARLRAIQEQLGDPPDEFHYRGSLVIWLAVLGRCAEAIALGERVVAGPAAPSIGTSALANAWRGVASARAVLGKADEARRAYAEAGAAYRAAGHHYQVGSTFLLELYEVVLSYYADDVTERRRLASDAETAWERASGALIDLPPRFAWLPLLFVEGGWDEATRLARAASSPGGRTGWRPFAASLLAVIAREQGDAELAWRLVQSQIPMGHATEPGDAIFLDTTLLQRLAAELAIDAGDSATAQSWLEAHDRWLDWSGAVLGRAEGHLGWSSYFRTVGRMTEARNEAERALAAAAKPRQPLALLAAHRLLGELETVARRYDNAATNIETALSLADACAAPYQRALCLVALAELRRASGHPADAKGLVDEARDLCTPLEANRALAEIDALEKRIESTRNPAPSYPAGLSGREVEVLQLVAEGLTDAQVAERLFLSRRTVSQHLRSIYNKLGVSSRAAATRFGVEQDLW